MVVNVEFENFTYFITHDGNNYNSGHIYDVPYMSGYEICSNSRIYKLDDGSYFGIIKVREPKD